MKDFTGFLTYRYNCHRQPSNVPHSLCCPLASRPSLTLLRHLSAISAITHLSHNPSPSSPNLKHPHHCPTSSILYHLRPPTHLQSTKMFHPVGPAFLLKECGPALRTSRTVETLVISNLSTCLTKYAEVNVLSTWMGSLTVGQEGS